MVGLLPEATKLLPVPDPEFDRPVTEGLVDPADEASAETDRSPDREGVEVIFAEAEHHETPMTYEPEYAP